MFQGRKMIPDRKITQAVDIDDPIDAALAWHDGAMCERRSRHFSRIAAFSAIRSQSHAATSAIG